MIVAVTMYQLRCSFPGCPAMPYGEEYYAFAEKEQAIEIAQDAGWRKGAGQGESGHWFCENHPTIWASDFETAGSTPESAWDLGAIGDFSYPFLILDDISKDLDTTCYLVLDQDMLVTGLDRLARDEPIQAIQA